MSVAIAQIFEQMLINPLLVPQALARNVAAEWHLYLNIGVALALGVWADVRRGAELRERYLSRRFRVDATYAVTDLLHISHLLVIMPLMLAVAAFHREYMSWLTIHSATQCPLWMRASLLFLLVDFWTYWYHRFQHELPVLWQFHKTHHSQEHLTALSNFRVTIPDRIVNAVVLSVPSAVFVMDASIPLALVVLQQFHQLITHSNVGWTFGPLKHLVVSPSFHEVHHSRLPQHLDRNYGAVLAVWDHLFGSFVPRGAQQLEYGLATERIPESWAAQHFVPLIGLWRLGKRKLTEKA